MNLSGGGQADWIFHWKTLEGFSCAKTEGFPGHKMKQTEIIRTTGPAQIFFLSISPSFSCREFFIAWEIIKILIFQRAPDLRR